MANEYKLLDGIWDFHFEENPLTQVMVNDIRFETVLTVPGCFDVQQDFFLRRGTGCYRCFVRCGGPVALEIGALGLRGRVCWDREIVGGTELPYSLETLVFDAGAPGEHELLILADNTLDTGLDSQFQPFYDFYGHGGIYRSVRLRELPETWIEQLRVIPRNIADGTVEVLVELVGPVLSGMTLELSFDDGEPVMMPVMETSMRLKLQVPEFRLWSPEQPFLHRLRIRVGGDEREVTFGIREVKAERGQILLNGQPLKLVGYNRHDSHPQFGAAMPDELLIADLRMIKGQGCNTIRGCHYPQSEKMLELCDRLGLLVWEETLGWGNPVNALMDPGFQARQLEQARRMVRKSINHPSVILWGFLNEAETSVAEALPLITKLFDAIRSEDDSRLVTFGSNRAERDLCLAPVDVISFNTYPGWYDRNEEQFFEPRVVAERLNSLAEFVTNSPYADKPLIISEIGAAALAGDHSGQRWSEEYQAALLETACRLVIDDPRYAGILIWQFSNARTYCGGGAPSRPRGFNNKGVVDEFRRPKLAWGALTALLRDQRKIR